jgi:hypothetical protein
MPYNPVDPADLKGDELTNWYLRSPDEIEQQRQAAAQRRYDDFFGPGASPKNGAQEETAGGDGAPNAAVRAPSPTPSIGFDPAYVDRGGADPDNGADFELVGNPHNPRLKGEWVQREGRPWPQTDDGRSYHVAHKKALADGGTNTLDNIEPMHPDEHIAQHIENGDFARWARRPGIARAFGGRVAEGVGAAGFLSDLLGMFTGRIRTDTFDNFSHDVVGQPSNQDRIEEFERQQKAITPGWKPGDPWVL